MDLRNANVSHRLFYYLKLLLLGSVILSACFILNRMHLSQFFPISTVRIYGAHHIEQKEIETVLLPLLKPGYFNVNIEHIRNELGELAWIRDSSVKRAWPDAIDIVLIEKKPVAYWNNQALLSESGDIFTPKRETYPVLLPELIGPDGQQIMVLNYFKDIDRLLLPLHVKMTRLELTPYLTWKLTLDNGMILQIGHKDILTRLDHFVKVYPKIVGERAKDVESVDLRYSNGVAVRWKVPS